ncbi:outer membrane protein [Brucella sp. TWI432]
MNGFIKIFCASLAVSLSIMAFAPAAVAADFTEEVPEVIVTPPAVGGWYLRGDIGYSWNRFKHADYATSPCTSNCGSSVFENNTILGDLKGSFLIGGGVGYQVTDYFRTDLTLDYMARSKFAGERDESHMSGLSLLANAYVDLGNFAGVTPYLGAGIGGTRVKWADVVDTQNNDVYSGDANWRFTYALMAGASVDLTHNLKLDAGYRYRHINGGKMFEGNPTIGNGYDKGMNVHDIRVGLRYMFGG